VSFLPRLVVSWAANAVVLAVDAAIFSGVTVHHSFWTLVLAAAVFGVLNTILKPILKLLTFPLALVTLGVAWFFVAMMMLWLTDVIVGGFDINGFWTLVGATVIAWLVNLVLDRVLFRRHEAERRRRTVVTFHT
jgi:putative membrane protein